MLVGCLAPTGIFYMLLGVKNSVKRHFLLPAGGAMTITEYEHGHVFRTERLSKV